jgi:hypothetical protein
MRHYTGENVIRRRLKMQKHSKIIHVFLPCPMNDEEEGRAELRRASFWMRTGRLNFEAGEPRAAFKSRFPHSNPQGSFFCGDARRKVMK